MIIENITNPGVEPVDGDRIRVIHPSGSTEEYEYHPYVEPPDTRTFLEITCPVISAIGQAVAMTATVKFVDGTNVPLTATYYVPVVRLGDNKQMALLTVNFVDGVATPTFTPTEAGIHTLNMGSIRPIPTAILGSNPEIIVPESTP